MKQFMAIKTRQKRPVAFHQTHPVLDDINLQILGALQVDPRMTMKALATLIGMSGPSATERVQRLEDAGVIDGARLQVDYRLLGLNVMAFVRVRPMPGALSKVVELAQFTPEVIECHRVTGEDCFVMKVLVARVEDLEAVLDDFLQYGSTTSSIVQSTPVALRSAPLPELLASN
jgi:Lrp/AsnC family transcriptional regulator, leucine-responsive regulatory protein